MKIVRLIEEFPPEINRGLSPNAYYISREQVKQGHQVWIFSFTKNNPSQEIKNGIAIHRIKRPRKIRWNGGVAFAEAIQKENINPDIVHGLNCIPFGWRLNKMRRLLKSKYVMSLHTSIVPLRHGYITGFFNKLRNFEFTLLCKFLARRVDLVLPISDFIKNELLETGISKEKIKVVSPGLDTNIFIPSRIKKEINFDNIKLLYVGRFSQMKGIEYLLQACKLLEDKNINFLLSLIGGTKKDDNYQYILDLINKYNLTEKIKIIPPLNQTKLINHYHNADIFILPSLYEPFGKVILEAHATGIPVISTKAGGVEDIIKDRQNGLLIRVKDSHDIVERILELYKNVDLRNRLIHFGLKSSREFNWSLISNKYIDAFSQMTEK